MKKKSATEKFGVIVWQDETSCEYWRFETEGEARDFYHEKIESYQMKYPEEIEVTGREDLDRGKLIRIPVFINCFEACCLESFEFYIPGDINHIVIQEYTRL